MRQWYLRVRQYNSETIHTSIAIIVISFPFCLFDVCCFSKTNEIIDCDKTAFRYLPLKRDGNLGEREGEATVGSHGPSALCSQ